MGKKTMLFLLIVSLMTMIFLPAASSVAESGLLPSLTETVGIAMPSLGEALQRYPDDEMENEDGSITELYTNVSESDFNTFSDYLQQQEAELADYKAEKGVLTAEIRAKGASFSLRYDSKRNEARVIYPFGTFDEWVKNAKTHFDTAQKLYAEGKTNEAVVEIVCIPQYTAYGPADSLMKEDQGFAATVAAREAKYASYKEVGNIVTFGTYPQTKDGKDRTPIEWLVLDYDETNNKTLLLSKYCLDAVKYSEEQSFFYTRWENCTLRTWLNDEFLKKAFSTKEQSAILITNVDNSANQSYRKWDTLDGNNTQDQIFLLSYAEANHYLDVEYEGYNNIGSRAAPTEYAIAQETLIEDRLNTADGEPAGIWWLRSPGPDYQAATVTYYGSLGCQLINYRHYVRPAFWLDLDADLF